MSCQACRHSATLQTSSGGSVFSIAVSSLMKVSRCAASEDIDVCLAG
jgi:uncharacterized membrane protein